MTFQPPPPPPPPAGPPPGGPPPGAWGPPPGGPPPSPGFDPKSINQLDWGILGAGLLAFIFSFTSYYSYSGKNCGSYCGGSVTESAWNGFFGWFAMLLAVIGSGLVAMSIFAPQVKLPVPARLAGLGCYAVATLCVILAIFIVPDYSIGGVSIGGSNIDKGHGFGYWISLIVIIAGLVLSLMRFQQSGGELPGALAKMPNIGGHRPGGPAGPPPQGYGPPPGPPPGYSPPPAPPRAP
jgi:hypothetical protein